MSLYKGVDQKYTLY